MLWNLLEVHIGIIAACAPSLISFFDSLRNRLSSYQRSYRTEYSQGSRRLPSTENLQLTPYGENQASVHVGPARPGSEATKSETSQKGIEPLGIYVRQEFNIEEG